MNSYDTATRVLVVYESSLPFGRPANLVERIEAMRRTIESLGLKETNSGANFRDVLRAAVEATP